MIAKKLQPWFLPSAIFRIGAKRLRVSSCHPERNEGSDSSPTRLWLNQMLRVAQHDNFVKEDPDTVN